MKYASCRPQKSGFYLDFRESGPGRRSVCDIDERFQLGWCIQKDAALDSGELLRFDRVFGDIVERNTNQLAGYLSLCQISPANDAIVSVEEFAEECDARSSDAYDLGQELLKYLVLIEDYFEFGPILLFEAMEVKQHFRGRGIGSAAFKVLSSKIRSKRKISACFLLAVPLQFRAGRAGDPVSSATVSRKASKLRSYYAREWGAQRLGPTSRYQVIDYRPSPTESAYF